MYFPQIKLFLKVFRIQCKILPDKNNLKFLKNNPNTVLRILSKVCQKLEKIEKFI